MTLLLRVSAYSGNLQEGS